MRTLFIILMAFFTLTMNAQVVREGNTFSSTKTINNSSKAEKTKFTWKDSKGVEYPIYISASGSCYVIKVSKKSGKEYKNYLGPEVSQEVCKALGREYKKKETNNKIAQYEPYK